MKTIFSVLLSLFMVNNIATAQKIKTKYLQVEYTDLPARPLDKTFKTYSVSVTDPFGAIKAGNLNAESLVKKHLTLNGFKALEGPSDFHINISIGQYVMFGHETKETKEKKTRKVEPTETETTSSSSSRSSNDKARVTESDTKKTTTTPEKTTTTSTKTKTETYYVTTYHKSIDYQLPIAYTIIDFEGNKIKEGTLVAQNKKLNYTYGKNSSDPVKLEERFKDKYSTVISGMVGNTIKNNVKSLGDWVKKNYDFQRKKENAYFRTLGKKSDGATEFNAAFAQVKTAFAKMKADQPIDKIKAEVKPAIETWLKLKEGYPMEKKRGRKGRHACLFNIASTFYWLDEFDEAIKYAKEGVAVGNKEKHLERLLTRIDNTKKLMRTNRVTTRHIDRDLEDYIQREIMPPNQGNPTAMQTNSVANPKDALVYDGFIVDKKGTRIKGKFVISNNKKKELDFGKQGNIEFRWNKNNVPQVSYLEPNNVKTFGFNKRTFNCQGYQTALDNDASKKKIMECLFDSDLIKVFKYYPYEQGVNNNKTEISMQRKSDTQPVSTVGDQFLIFKKGLSVFFKDCTELSELALDGEFERNEVDIVRAAKAYTQFCK